MKSKESIKKILNVASVVIFGIILIAFDVVIIGGLLVIGAIAFVLFKKMFFTKHVNPPNYRGTKGPSGGGAF